MNVDGGISKGQMDRISDVKCLLASYLKRVIES